MSTASGGRRGLPLPPPVGDRAMVQRAECQAAGSERLGGRDRAPKVVRREMTDRGPRDDLVPGTTEHGVETDPHEAVIGADRPSARTGEAGELDARESQPAAEKELTLRSRVRSRPPGCGQATVFR